MNNNIKLLIKEYIAFNPASLNDGKPKSKLSTDTVKDILNVMSINEVKILWDDLNVYTLSEVKYNKPDGYPIGINLFDNKYLSFKYMSKNIPIEGSNTYTEFQFCKENKTPKVLFDDNLKQKISDLKVELKNGVFKLLDDKLMKDRFKYFNGKEQTLIFLNDVEDRTDYPAAEHVYAFNPGKTLKGDWYIPSIGELVYVYAYKDIINHICSELINLGYKSICYNDMYLKIENTWYWSSTFCSSDHVYSVDMRLDIVSYDYKNNCRDILVMLELPTT